MKNNYQKFSWTKLTWVYIKWISELCSTAGSCSKMFEVSPVGLVDTSCDSWCPRAPCKTACVPCNLCIAISWSPLCSKTSWMRSLKSYKVFGVTLIIKENNKDIWIFRQIHNRIVQHFWPGRILSWRNNHRKVPCAILTNQHTGEVHVAISSCIPCIPNWIRSIFGKIHTTSKSPCKSNPDTNLQTWEKLLYCFKSLRAGYNSNLIP